MNSIFEIETVNLHNLQRLYKHVSDLPVDVPWSMYNWAFECGTAACLLGHATNAMPELLKFVSTGPGTYFVSTIDEEDWGYQAAMTTFGLTNYGAHYLFNPNFYLGNLDASITREHALARLGEVIDAIYLHEGDRPCV